MLEEIQMLRINTPSYKKKFIDGWLVIMDEGMYIKREDDTYIAIKNKEGKIVKINGSKEVCDKCYQGLEGLPDYDRYTSLCHWDYIDAETILFQNNRDHRCFAWDSKDEDFTDALEEIQDHIKSNADSIVVVYGNYTLEKLDRLLKGVMDNVDDNCLVMTQLLQNADENPVLFLIV